MPDFEASDWGYRAWGERGGRISGFYIGRKGRHPWWDFGLLFKV